MPRTQVATVANYEFGSPGLAAPANTPSLQFSAKRGGSSIEARIEAYDEAVVLTGQVSQDGVTWAAMTTAGNGDAMASVTVNPGGHVKRAFHLRPGLDNYLRFISAGGRGTLQMRGSENLEVQKL